MQISPVVSDLATQKSLLQRGSAVRAQMQTASQEMSSGLKSDLVAATGGDLGGLFAIERGIVQLDSQIEGLNFAAAKASSAENYLGQLAAGVAPFGVDLQAALDRGDALAQTSIAKGARAAFDAAVSALNGRYGRHALFAGAALDGPAVPPTGWTQSPRLTAISMRPAAGLKPAPIWVAIPRPQGLKLPKASG